MRAEVQAACNLLDELGIASIQTTQIQKIKQKLQRIQNPIRKDIMVAVHETLLLVRREDTPARNRLINWKETLSTATQKRYSSHLHSESTLAASRVPAVPAIFEQNSPKVRGFEILNAAFDDMLARDPRIVIFGEDVGQLGGVNQALAGLQAKYGELRVSDTGIREATIIGQAIGMALRGLRPIAEIQYLDYLLYALQILSDDLATLHWRTRGGQKAPLIVRTRGHRLEGIWHTGSPMGGIIHMLRGMHVLVPRNMTQAAGFYNALLQGDEPGLIVEALNGYRLRERLPENIGSFTVPLGVPELLRSGEDVTIVTYGPLCRITLEAAAQLREVGIDAEVIDVQSLLPFDTHERILQSLKKTNRILFVDEECSGRRHRIHVTAGN